MAALSHAPVDLGVSVPPRDSSGHRRPEQSLAQQSHALAWSTTTDGSRAKSDEEPTRCATVPDTDPFHVFSVSPRRRSRAVHPQPRSLGCLLGHAAGVRFGNFKDTYNHPVRKHFAQTSNITIGQLPLVDDSGGTPTRRHFPSAQSLGGFGLGHDSTPSPTESVNRA